MRVLQKSAWKTWKAGIIDRWEYLARYRRLAQCEEPGCINKAVMTISVYMNDKSRAIASFRSCAACAKGHMKEDENDTKILHHDTKNMEKMTYDKG